MLCIMLSPIRGIRMEVCYLFINRYQSITTLSIFLLDKNSWRVTNVKNNTRN